MLFSQVAREDKSTMQNISIGIFKSLRKNSEKKTDRQKNTYIKKQSNRYTKKENTRKNEINGKSNKTIFN